MERRYGGDLSPPPRPPKPTNLRTHESVHQPSSCSAATRSSSFNRAASTQKQYRPRAADPPIMQDSFIQSTNSTTATIETTQQRTNTLRTINSAVTIPPFHQSNGNFPLVVLLFARFSRSFKERHRIYLVIFSFSCRNCEYTKSR